MKINHNDLYADIRSTEFSIKTLATLAESIDRNKIPNSKLEILNERIELIDKAIIDLFDIFNEYED
jgi:hypothetical protein